MCSKSESASRPVADVTPNVRMKCVLLYFREIFYTSQNVINYKNMGITFNCRLCTN